MFKMQNFIVQFINTYTEVKNYKKNETIMLFTSNQTNAITFTITNIQFTSRVVKY